jgi:hypothetical protein
MERIRRKTDRTALWVLVLVLIAVGNRDLLKRPGAVEYEWTGGGSSSSTVCEWLDSGTVLSPRDSGREVTNASALRTSGPLAVTESGWVFQVDQDGDVKLEDLETSGDITIPAGKGIKIADDGTSDGWKQTWTPIALLNETLSSSESLSATATMHNSDGAWEAITWHFNWPVASVEVGKKVVIDRITILSSGLDSNNYFDWYLKTISTTLLNKLDIQTDNVQVLSADYHVADDTPLYMEIVVTNDDGQGDAQLRGFVFEWHTEDS